MRTSRSFSGKSVDERWHRERKRIRETIYNEDSLSPEEKVLFDVGEDRPRGITLLPSIMNDEIYTTDPEFGGEGARKRVDIRDLPFH